MRLVRLNEVKYTDSKDKINALLEKGFVADVVSESVADVAPETVTEVAANDTDSDYKKLKKDELIALAKERGVEIHANDTKEEIVDALEAADDHE